MTEYEPQAMTLQPFTLTFVGTNLGGTTEPTEWQISDRKPSPHGGVWMFRDMSIVERAVLRALCNEALRRLDATEAEEEDA